MHDLEPCPQCKNSHQSSRNTLATTCFTGKSHHISCLPLSTKLQGAVVVVIGLAMVVVFAASFNGRCRPSCNAMVGPTSKTCMSSCYDASAMLGCCIWAMAYGLSSRLPPQETAFIIAESHRLFFSFLAAATCICSSGTRTSCMPELPANHALMSFAQRKRRYQLMLAHA